MYNHLDMKEILRLFKTKWKMMILVVSLCFAIGGVVSYTIPPTYIAKTDLLVNYTMPENESTPLQSSDIEMSLRLIETYKHMLKSDRMLSQVIGELNETYTKSELLNKVSIESGNNSQIITIVAQEDTAEKSATLVNTYATTFQEQVEMLMNIRNITILNEVSVDSGIKKVELSLILVVAISLIIGFIITAMIIIIQEFYFTKLNTVSKIEGSLKIPNLGTLPIIKNKKWNNRRRKLISVMASSLELTDEFRRIRANVQFQMTEKSIQTILVTSPVFGEGKSLISSNLATVMAMDGKKTVFIDADLRTPIGRHLFDLPERKGLTSIVSGDFQLNEIIQHTETENLYFISAGPIPPNPAEVLSSTKMKNLLTVLKEQFDVIIIDTPPLVVADCLGLSTMVEGCLYVIDAERTKEKVANKSLGQLQKVGVPILGTILNRSYAHKKGHLFTSYDLFGQGGRAKTDMNGV